MSLLLLMGKQNTFHKPVQFSCSESERNMSLSMDRQDSNNSSNISSERSEQEVHFFTGLIALFGFFFGFLLTLVGLKYQSSGAALFHAHSAIMVLLVIDVCTCTIALAAVILTTFNTKYLDFLKYVSLISGAFACDLLLLVLIPPFGWFIFTICVSILACLVYGSYQEILKCCQEIQSSISHSTSQAFEVLCNRFRQNSLFQSIWRTPSQAFNGSPMLTPNMPEQEVVGLALDV